MPPQNQTRALAGMAFSGRRPTPQFAPRSTARAFLEGALDDFTFGLDDQLSAAVGGISDKLHGKDGWAAYQKYIKAEHERDRIDAAVHGRARGWGKSAGAAGQMLVAGPLGALVPTGVRVAEVTPIVLRELAAIGTTGAVGGMAAHAGVNRAMHHSGTWGDLAAAGVGGGIEALLSRTGQTKTAGAIGGAATSIATDIFNGRLPSLQRATEAAGAGGLLSAGAGAAGRKLSNMLPNQSLKGNFSKEDLGELGSMIRTLVNGDWTATRRKFAHYLPGGGFTKPDQRTVRGKVIESKFGWSADLSKRQKQAYRELGSEYRVDHFLPDDVGALLAHPTVQLAHYLKDIAGLTPKSPENVRRGTNAVMKRQLPPALTRRR